MTKLLFFQTSQTLIRLPYLVRFFKAPLFLKIALFMLFFSAGMSYAGDNPGAPDESSLYAITAPAREAMAPTLTVNPSPEAADRTITGTVTDEKGEPLIGVSIMVRGTTTGTTTNASGQFSLTVPDDAVLVISYIGFEAQTLPVRNQTSFSIILYEDTQLLEEVVVVGYGTQRKRDVAGSIASISNKDLSIHSTTNMQNLLQGRLSGVSVATSGVPGTAPVIRVRGIGTLSDNSPLYVIDGFPTKSSGAANLNPASIESIQVLKDASSASIYGAQAANGVILITTKQGKTGKAELDIKVNSGVQMPTNLPKLLNTQQWGEVLWNAMRNAGLTPTHVQYGSGPNPVIPDFIVPQGASASEVNLSAYDTQSNQFMQANKTGTNWFQEIFRPAQMTNVDLSARGGSEDSKYFINANYASQDALVKWAGYDRISLRGNSQFTILKHLNLGTNLGVRYSRYKGGSSNSDAALSPPIIPVRDVMGNWAGTKANGLADGVNPVASLYNQRHNQSQSLNILGNIYLELNFLNAFQFKSTAGANLSNGASKSFSPTTFWNKADKNTFVNSLSVGRSNSLELVWTNTLTYSKTFLDSHHVNVLVGSEALTYEDGSLGASRNSFLVEDPDYRYLTAGELNINNSESGGAYSLFSLFTRINYNYKERYYISAVLRRDGSSRFGSNNRYGYFPGVSAAWRLSEEAFMGDQTILSDLKLRASYGTTGNSEIGNYAYASTYNTSVASSSYPIQGDPNSVTMGIYKEALGNPDLKWETTTQTNFGLDAAFLNNQLAIQFDYYHKYTKDILQRLSYPATAGRASAPYENIGEMLNQGLEFSINYRNTAEKKDFTYDLGLILFGYRNEVKKLAADQFISSGSYNRTYVGEPIGRFYGFIIDGIFQDQQEVDNHATQTAKAIGRWKFRDVNGDGIINDNDRDFIGDPHPKFEYSLNGRFYYKNFDLALYFQGTYGNDICFESKTGQSSLDFWADYFNKSVRILDTWTPENRNAKLPEINILNPNSEGGRVTSYLIEDGSYFRLKFLELGYNMPVPIMSKMNIKNCRIYLNAENLLTFTKYNNIDPEVRSSNDLQKGVDNINRLPLAKIFTLGLNFTF